MNNLIEESGGKVTGWGMALGTETVTNADLAAKMDTSNEWILERTGISERRIGGSTSGLAVRAGQQALEMAGVKATEIDLLILA
ncbi:MAG: 3-oxoacyl-ACP synthase, partial [Acidimicrobiaceae bacterium]|nr:3-oxoacyl-ACP synthase [Acidimicrobiaceae bacterium]